MIYNRHDVKRHESSGLGMILGLLVALAVGIAVVMYGMAPTLGSS